MTGIKSKVYLNPLKPLKSLKRMGFYTFDVETKDGLTGKQLYSWSLCYKPKGRYSTYKTLSKCVEKFTLDNEYLEKHNTFLGTNVNDFSELFDKFKKWKDKSHYRVIYVHNLSFDIRFIVDYASKKNIEFKPIISGSNMIACIFDKFNIMFIDSVQYLRSSQDKAEKEWNVPAEFRKKETNAHKIFEKPYSAWTKNERYLVFKHNLFDTIALYICMDKFREVIYEIAHVDTLTTISIAMLSLKAFRVSMYKNECIKEKTVSIKNGKEVKKRSICNPVLYFTNKGKGCSNYGFDKIKEDFMRESYFGGRNEVFDLNKYFNLLYIDRVSMFPAEMFKNKFPTSYPIWYCYTPIKDNWIKNKKHDSELQQLEDIINGKDKRLAIIEATINPKNCQSNYPVLPKRIDKRVMFTYMSYKGTYTSIELQYARECGYEIKPIKGLVYEHSEYIFKNYVNKFFYLKANSKGGRKIGAKYLLNTCYGKFGQAPERNEIETHYFSTQSEMLDFDEQNLGVKDSVKRYDSESGMFLWMQSIPKINLRPFMIVAIASFVTSYARVSLTKLIHFLEQKGIDTIYCDTDSVVIPKADFSIIEEYSESNLLGLEKLGAWEVEQSFKEIKFLAPKAYIFTKEKIVETIAGMNIKEDEIGIKLKGVARDKIKEIRETSQDLNEVEERIREPIELAERYMKFKESHRYGQVLASKELTKHYSFENLKRKFDKKSGKSIAWNDENAPQKYLDQVKY